MKVKQMFPVNFCRFCGRRFLTPHTVCPKCGMPVDGAI